MEPPPAPNAWPFKTNGPWHISLILNLPNIQDVIAVLGKEPIQAAFEEYTHLHPSPNPVAATTYAAYIHDMLGSHPSTEGILHAATDNEPWAEALFAHRVKTYLESAECTALAWSYADYYHLDLIRSRDAEERRWYRYAVVMERYYFALVILERLQLDRYLKDPTRDLEKNLERIDLSEN
ncbi:hypothetical protein F5Y06DRAFT_295731 [Hypoxylon sp. FL0890]|nr:hypothetical protein F5Y06DRAFT_295731 [Hypoxylon sp. FL0890]